MPADSCLVSVKARWLVPVDNERRGYIDDGVIVFEKASGLILFVGSQSELPSMIISEEVDLPGDQVLMPGLINMHSHSPMALMKGFSEDLALHEWLQEIWSAESKLVDDAFVKTGSELACHEMLLTGTTTFADMYFRPQITAEVAQRAGMRVALGEPILCFTEDVEDSELVATPPDHLINCHLCEKCKNDKVTSSISSSCDCGCHTLSSHPALVVPIETHKHITTNHSPLSTVSLLSPHAPYTVPNHLLKKIKQISDAYGGVRVNIHLQETEKETREHINKTGETPVRSLDRLGLLNDRLIAAHCVSLDDDDIKILGERKVNVVTCPKSNLKLASGICQVQALMHAGVNMCVGTDGCCSNNSLDLLGDLQWVSLLGKINPKDSTALDCLTVIRMATINGAKALGLDRTIGSLEKGKQCDMIAVDFNDLTSQPVIDPLSSVIHTSSGKKISQVWIQGRRVVEDGQVKTFTVDMEALTRFKKALVACKPKR